MAAVVSFPRSDPALLAFSLNLSTKITATPTAYGLVAADATAYAAKHAAFATALLAVDPNVRNKAAVITKNQARADLKAAATLIALKVQSTATVTAAQKTELGLSVKATPAPWPVPSEAPSLDIVSVVGRKVTVRLHDAANPGRRGKPDFVAGATVFSYVGATPPTDTAAYKFEGNTTKTIFEVTFSESVAPGAQVWLCAFWRNESDEPGPACLPVGAVLQYGMTSEVA